MLKDNVEILSKPFLAQLDKGLQVLRFEVSYPEIEGFTRVVFALFAMLAICSTCHRTGYTKAVVDPLDPIEDFKYSLGASQLYGFFELQHKD
jgi:hypothetical protein